MTQNDSEWLGELFYLKKINPEYTWIPLRMTWNDLEWLGMSRNGKEAEF